MKISKIKFLFTLFFFASTTLFAQQTQTPKIYDEKVDAMKQIQTAIAEAQTEGKYVFCQVGGNWCPWCIRFASFVENDTIIKPLMDSNFVYIHVNWSRDNKNPEAMKFLGNPGRFGFPVFVIIDEKGKPIHIQNSAYLEQDKGYSTTKVKEFLQNWTPQAVNTLR
jgi:thiol:disulfide interchange protein